MHFQRTAFVQVRAAKLEQRALHSADNHSACMLERWILGDCLSVACMGMVTKRREFVAFWTCLCELGVVGACAVHSSSSIMKRSSSDTQEMCASTCSCCRLRGWTVLLSCISTRQRWCDSDSVQIKIVHETVRTPSHVSSSLSDGLFPLTTSRNSPAMMTPGRRARGGGGGGGIEPKKKENKT
jgi:hypothetical protein